MPGLVDKGVFYMIAAGLQLMVLGMSIVFLFLVILVFLMTLTSAIVRRFEGAPVPVGTAPTASGSASRDVASFDTHIPAILAAVAAHRSRIGREKNSESNTTHS
jgi:oxaloacetate decarboxylase gamma subunit